jgi:hypothetical protein
MPQKVFRAENFTTTAARRKLFTFSMLQNYFISAFEYFRVCSSYLFICCVFLIKFLTSHTYFSSPFTTHRDSARYSYENCVYNSALHKCTRSSAEFTKKIVELLSSERQFKNCAKIEGTLCSDAVRISFDLMCLLLSASALSLLLLLTRRQL